MVQALTQEDIARKIAELQGNEGAGEASAPVPSRRFVKPLTNAADSLIEALRMNEGINLGLPEIDVLTRGFRPTDFVICTGFAHSAKTQLVLTMILNNLDKHILFFSLDDPAEMVLAKLVAMYTGISSLDIERRIREGDEDAIAIIREAASDTFSNLLVVDDVIGINAMQTAVAESGEVWDRNPDAVIIDYLEMMPGTATDDDEAANVKSKANDLKKWAKHAPYPLICLHQGTRSNSKPGDPITITSMGFSGEQQATQIIGTRRKRDLKDLEAWDRQNHENTVTVHVVKNKRPGGRCTHHDGVDFHLEPETGLIRPLAQNERSRLLDPDSAAARASRIASEQTVLEGVVPASKGVAA